MNEKIARIIIVVTLAATGLIHWFLPAFHPGAPGDLTGGLIKIPHQTLHSLFNLNGVGYFVLMGIVLDWFPVRPKHIQVVYLVIALYATATIVAWILFSEPTGRTLLDPIDKAIEVVLTLASVWMFVELSKKRDAQPEH